MILTKRIWLDKDGELREEEIDQWDLYMTKPTPAQIEAESFIELIKRADLIVLHIGDKKAGLGKDMQDRIVSALTAAAEVGEWQKTAHDNAMQVLAERNAELMERLKITIERCAQAVRDIYPYDDRYDEVVKVILALKDKPLTPWERQYSGDPGP